MGRVYTAFIKKKVHPPETPVLVTTFSMPPGNTCDLDQATTLSAFVFSPKRGRLALPICPGYRGNDGMPEKHFGNKKSILATGASLQEDICVNPWDSAHH